MGSFLQDGDTQLPGVKADLRPAAVPPSSDEWAAADANKLREALRDVRTAIVALDQLVVSTGSTTGRSLADRFADVVNIKDYGAVCDGVTDDSAAVTAMIALLGATQRAVIVTGNCVLDSNVEFPANLTVLQAGGGRFSGAGTVSYLGLRAKVGPGNVTLVGAGGSANIDLDTTSAFVFNGPTGASASINADDFLGITLVHQHPEPVEIITNSSGLSVDRFLINAGLGLGPLNGQSVNAMTWVKATFNTQPIQANSSVEVSGALEGHENGTVAALVAFNASNSVPDGIVVTARVVPSGAVYVRLSNVTAFPIAPSTQDFYVLTFSCNSPVTGF